MFLTIIAFIVIFSLLVLVHEWGHFAAARKAGIKVEEFGIGLPPQAKAIHKDKRGTVYSINWIPFGGFVRLYGEDSTDPKILKDKKSFASKSLWQRTQVIVGGVFMNFILAWVLISFGFAVGMQPFLINPTDLKNGIEEGFVIASDGYYIHQIIEGSGLEKAGIKSGAFISKINDIEISKNTKISDIIKPNQEVDLTYYEGNDLKEIMVKADGEGKIGAVLSVQKKIEEIKDVKYPFYIAPVKAAKETVRLSYETVNMLGRVVSNLVGQFSVPDGVAGPVGIFKMTGQYAEKGFISLIQFTALLSISLGVINIMPFPALDGGRFLFIIYELIARRKANAKWEAIIHSIGFILLMILILIITWNDIMNLIAS